MLHFTINDLSYFPLYFPNNLVGGKQSSRLNTSVIPCDNQPHLPGLADFCMKNEVRWSKNTDLDVLSAL